MWLYAYGLISVGQPMKFRISYMAIVAVTELH